jgi:flagellum-specific ATP synthase
LGARLETGMAAFNTVLPIVRGQRLGLFAGSGVGKSSLLGHLGKNMQADVVVFALIGERGRELREFVEKVLGPEGMRRAVIVAATSDMSPLVRRRCAWAAMAVAEYYRDLGHQVLFLADSITRFAEAHREVATVSGELPALRGYPASTSHMIMSLCERAGPGAGGATSRRCSAFWSRVRIWMNLLPISCVGCLMGMWCLIARLPSGAAIRPLTFCAPSRAACRMRRVMRKTT